MITKLSIKNFGIFKEFTWGANNPPFRRHNVIYGWNYSGKTTLSRIFRCFDTGSLHPDFSNPEFTLIDDAGATFSQSDVGSGRLSNVRVFNTDFVSKHLKAFAPDGLLDPIFLLGEENVDLQKLLAHHRGKLVELQLQRSKSQDELRLAKAKRDDSLTDKAREIKNTLSVPNFDREKLQPYIDAVRTSPLVHRLDESTLARTLVSYRSQEAMDKVGIAEEPTFSLKELSAETDRLCANIVSPTRVLEELSKDHGLGTWVDEGRSLHRERQTCGFCGQKLPLDRLKHLDEHFTKEYDRLQASIRATLEDIKEHAKAVAKFSLPGSSDSYPELRSEYDRERKSFTDLRTAYQTSLTRLEKTLEEKRVTPFAALKPEQVTDPTADLQGCLERIRAIIKRHNDKTDNFAKERHTALETLYRHYAAEFVIDKKYDGMLAEIGRLGRHIERIKSVMDGRTTKVTQIEGRLSETVKGADTINRYIHLLTGRNEICVEVTDDDKFRLIRGTSPATNLSEGEKTAIALAYFVARLEERGTVLQDTVVFIDDPVSSFDHNHLFAAYAFVKDNLSDCAQLFVSTHNIDFFNLMKDFLREFRKPNGDPLYPKRSMPCYLVERAWNGNTNAAAISDAPRILKHFRSEYVYLFSILRRFGQEAEFQDFDLLYLIPNVLRRFLESYTGFRLPGEDDQAIRYGQLFPDQTKRARVRKLVDEYSHNQTVDRAFKFPEAAECKTVVTLTLSAIESADKSHFDSLCEACA